MQEPNSKRIAKNTLLLYCRMIIIMLISLYTVRLVLKALGAEDYGVFNVVAGVVTMLNSVCAVLTTSVQRYYSYYIGCKNDNKLKEIFSAGFNLFSYFSLIVIIIGETIGLWFVTTQLSIPTSRMNAAIWVYQFSIFSFIFTMIQVPYSAAVIAHEDMQIYSIFTIVEYIVKLLFAALLLVLPFDSLVFYGVGIFIAQGLLCGAYWYYGHSHYAECKHVRVQEKHLYKDLISFSGWTLFGQLAGVGMYQINTILINIFFGPLITASRAISLQVNNALMSCCNSFIMAIRPPMIKTYAENNFNYVNLLFNASNKIIYYGMLCLCIPLYIEMDYILMFWLDISDELSIVFSRLIVIYSVILAINNPISIIIQATGKVKEYHVMVEFFTLLCMPATFICFKLGFSATFAYYIMLICVILSHIVRIICLKRYYPVINIGEYFKSFIIPALVITFFVYCIELTLSKYIVNELWKLGIIITSSILLIASLVFAFGLSKQEKTLVVNWIQKHFKQDITNQK